VESRPLSYHRQERAFDDRRRVLTDESELDYAALVA
jgi:hypothetical protein